MRSTPSNELGIGAIDLVWLGDWIAEHGPWAFHATAAENAASIRTDGLRPGDGSSRIFSAVATPRRGHVYVLADARDVSSQWELSGVPASRGIVVCVDLRALHPSRLVPDEDPWSLGVGPSECRRWFDPDRVSSHIGPIGSWPDGGSWAEAAQLGAQPGIVEWAISSWGAFAVRDAIEPAALTICECDAAGRFTPPGCG